MQNQTNPCLDECNKRLAFAKHRPIQQEEKWIAALLCRWEWRPQLVAQAVFWWRERLARLKWFEEVLKLLDKQKDQLSESDWDKIKHCRKEGVSPEDTVKRFRSKQQEKREKERKKKEEEERASLGTTPCP
jgi:ribosomal protein S16